MDARRFLWVACLVLAAGCQGVPVAPGGGLTGSGGGAATSTVTAAPVPRDATLAPGVTRAGVVDPERLGAAHEAALRDTSYTLRSERTVRYVGGPVRSSLRVRVALADDRTYLARAATAGPEAPVFLGVPPAEATFWSNGSVYVRRFSAGGTTAYNRFDPTGNAGTWQYWARTVPYGGRDSHPAAFYAGTFAAVTTRVTDVTDRDTDDGETLVRLEGSGTRDSVADSPLVAGTPFEDVRNVTLHATVDARGVVRSYELTYRVTVDGRPARVHWTVSCQGVGSTTVSRPSWFDRAVEGDGTGAQASAP